MIATGGILISFVAIKPNKLPYSIFIFAIAIRLGSWSKQHIQERFRGRTFF
jgi:hypothetical protein